MTTFTAMVRFDLGRRDVVLSVGGEVEPGAVDELCELVQRTALVSGRQAAVDLSGATIGDDALAEVAHRCHAVAHVVARRAA
ncbi:hypothetical protein ACFUMH_18855 [Cellulomonas sp. NPDC057328]|uniref:hypothetical protein n=1 Tax=Cellulomonas sp. NPDC057328 TaxID=3346101 RepID=UPI00362D98FA